MNNEIRGILPNRKTLIFAIKVIFLAVIFLAITACLAFFNDVHFSFLTRDPIVLLNGKAYIGFISNTGIIFWCSTAAILFFSSKILQSRKRKESREAHFLFFSGLLTLVLLLDDFFLLHDVIFPEYFYLGDTFFYGIYILATLAIIIFYRRLILNTEYLLFLLSLLFLGVSALVDSITVINESLTYPYSVEDSFKFLGIIMWFTYFTRTSFKFVSYFYK